MQNNKNTCIYFNVLLSFKLKEFKRICSEGACMEGG